MASPLGRPISSAMSLSTSTWFADAVTTQDEVDQRREIRSSVLLRAVIYPIDRLSDINIVNVSHTGIQGESTLELAVGEVLHISFNEKTYCRGVVQWTTHHKFGLKFDEQIALAYALNDVEKTIALGHLPRARRIEWNTTGRLATGRPPRPATVRNVSQSGMQLDTTVGLREGQLVIVEMNGSPLMLSRVQWASDRRLGVKAI